MDSSEIPSNTFLIRTPKMNISYPVPIDTISPAIGQLGHETVKAATFLLIPAELLYFSIYFHRKGLNTSHKYLSILSLITLWSAPFISPVSWYVVFILSFVLQPTWNKLLRE